MSQEQLMEMLRQQLTGETTVQDSIARLAQSDPQLGQFAELLAQREQQLREDLNRREEEDRRAEEEAQRLDERRRRAESWRDHLTELTTELEATRSLLDELTAALGACPSCVGTDQGCRWCRGRGRPGYMAPDPAGFERLVLPAVRMHVRLRGRLASGTTTPSTPEGTAS